MCGIDCFELSDNSCVLDASWNLWDSALLHRGIDVGVVQEKLRHAPGNNIKEYLALNTEERDDPELLNGT